MIKRREYEYKEKVYSTSVNPDGQKQLFLQWELSKDLDEYHKCRMDWGITLMGYSEKKTKEGRQAQGNLEIKSNAVLIFDKEDAWMKSGFRAFIRHFYDKFVDEQANDHLEKDLRRDLEFFFQQIKTYLGLK